MLDDGTILFLANVNTYSLYARTMTFSVSLLLEFI